MASKRGFRSVTIITDPLTANQETVLDIRLPELSSQFTGSVLDLLINRDDIPLASSKCDISAIGASSDIADALMIEANDPLLYFSSLLFSTRGRIIDSSFSYFIPGYFHFHIVRRVGDHL